MARIYYDEDETILRLWEAERIELVGPTLEYYLLQKGTNVDALYNEPTNDPLYGGSDPLGTPLTDATSWNFYPDINKDSPDPTLDMPCAIEYQEMDNRTPTVREEGVEVEYDAILFIARNHWEDAIDGTAVDGRTPYEGDVCYVHNEWWDVIRPGKGGNILDSSNFVGYKLELMKRTKFTPDRKV